MSEAFSWSVNCKRTLSTSMSAILYREKDDEQQNNRQFLYGKYQQVYRMPSAAALLQKKQLLGIKAGLGIYNPRMMKIV